MKSERLKTRGADCDSIKIPEGLRPRKSQNFSSSLIAEKNKTKQNKIWLGFKAIKQEEFPLTQGKVSIFIFFKLSTDWKKRSIHIREGNLLNSIDWFKCQPETRSQKHQNGIWPNASAPHGSVKLMHKINHLKSSLCQLGMHTYLLKPSVIFK